MKRIYISKLIAVILCASLMTGCFPSGETSLVNDNSGDESQQEDALQQIMREISDIASQNDNLTVDVEIPENVPSEVPTIKVEFMDWDEEKLKEMFVDTHSVLTELNEAPSDAFKGETYKYYYSENFNDSFRIERGNISMAIDKENNQKMYFTVLAWQKSMDYGNYFGEGSIDLFSRDGAQSRTDALMDEMGLTNHSEPKIYSITADKVNKMLSVSELKDKDNNPVPLNEWTSDDEVYIVEYTLEFNGIPLSMEQPPYYNDGGHGGRGVGTKSAFLVSKDDILGFYAEDIYSPDYELSETAAINCSAEEALYQAVIYFDNLTSLNDRDAEIHDIKLAYVPFNKIDDISYTCIPMWEIDISLSSDDRLPPSKHAFYVNAQTGDEPLW